MKLRSTLCLGVFLGGGCVTAQSDLPDAECLVLDFAPKELGPLRENVAGVCGGQGECVEGVCLCDEGWSGRADFLDTTGEDCPIFENAIRSVWGINSFFVVVYFFLGLPKVILRWSQHLELYRQKKEAGQTYSLKNNRGMMACLAMYGLCMPSLLAYNVLIQIDPGQRVGLDLPATVCFAVARTGFYTSVWLFQPALLSTILKGKRSTRHLVKVNDYCSLALCLFAILLGYIPFITLQISDGTDDNALLLYYVLIGGTWLQIVMLGIQAVYVRVKVAEVLTQSYELTKQDRILKIKDALIEVQRENLIQACIQCTIYSLLLVWPFMYNKHNYVLPISWIAYGILGKKLAYTTVSYSTAQSSSTRNSENSKDTFEAADFSNVNVTSQGQSSSISGYTPVSPRFNVGVRALQPYSGPIRTPPPPPSRVYSTDTDDEFV